MEVKGPGRSEGAAWSKNQKQPQKQNKDHPGNKRKDGFVILPDAGERYEFVGGDVNHQAGGGPNNEPDDRGGDVVKFKRAKEA